MKNEPSEHPDVRYERKDIRLGGLLLVDRRGDLRAGGCEFWRMALLLVAGGGRASDQAVAVFAGAGAVRRSCRPSRGWSRSIGWRQGEAANVFAKLAAQEKVLNSYGPTEEKGFVHIPIQQAIKVIAGKLPVRTAAAGDGCQRPGADRCGRVQFRPHVSRRIVMGGGHEDVTAKSPLPPGEGQGEGRSAERSMLLALAAWLSSSCAAQDQTPEVLKKVGFDQRLNEQVPLDLPFTDEKGTAVKLGDYFGDKPVILVLAYYRCPMLCTLVLNGLTQAMRTMPFTIGKEFNVVTVSFDPRETRGPGRRQEETLYRRLWPARQCRRLAFSHRQAGRDRKADRSRRVSLCL